jgi:hypothetical protein
VLAGAARPWRDAGYTVQYRRYYPHLTRADLGRYRVILFLLGREPEGPSDALTAADLTLLDAWLAGGGIVVLGYGAGAGSLDRWSANRWLRSRGAGIAIQDETTDSALAAGPRGTPRAEARRLGDDPLGAVYDSFPLGRSAPLRVRRASQVLAVQHPPLPASTDTAAEPRPAAAVVAATRVGNGLIVVISREALAALAPIERPSLEAPLDVGDLASTRDFLTALARWTRRPAEWAHVPPARRPTPLSLADAPAPLDHAPPLAAPPDPVPTLPLRAPPVGGERPKDLPTWIRETGIRALWAPLLVPRAGRDVERSQTAFDSLVGWLDQAGLNLLAGDAEPQVAADSLHYRWEARSAVRRAWTQAREELQPTSFAWLPAFDLAGYRPVARWTDSSHGARGEAIATPCLFDSLYWKAGVAPAYLELARLAGQARPLVPALALDLAAAHPYPTGYSMGQEFCDAAWRIGLRRLGRGASLDSLPVAQRYPTLLRAGLLPRYYGALEDWVAARARALRDRALRESPGLLFALRLPHLPDDWFTLGLVRGFSQSDRPLLLFTPEVVTRPALAAYRARGLNVVHAVELPLALIRPSTLAALKAAAFHQNDGFWIAEPPGGAAQLGRVLRRLAR